MKITIIGGSRGTGAQVATAAHQSGHEVTVVSRSEAAGEGLRTIVGSATDPEVAREAVAGADAVVITVGGAKGVRHQRTAVTRALIHAMQQAGVRRLVVQSSLGAGGSASQLAAPMNLLAPIVLAKPLADHDEQESAVLSSGLDWTVVRPSGLTDKTPHGRWRVAEMGSQKKLGGTIPRGDLAAFIIEVLEEDSHIGKAVGISS